MLTPAGCPVEAEEAMEGTGSVQNGPFGAPKVLKVL